jgi:cytoskeletal protein CcmA (bactofilin family)
MFGSKKKETINANSSKATTAPGSHSLNTLVHGTVVEGAIKSDSDIRVDGVIKGSLHCNAKVIIGPTGHIEGEIRCVNAVIEGKFEGNLHVSELLNIRENAVVNGDVKTSQLIVQAGAVFNVTCAMGNNLQSRPGNFESSLKGSKAIASNGQQHQTASIKEAS